MNQPHSTSIARSLGEKYQYTRPFWIGPNLYNQSTDNGYIPHTPSLLSYTTQHHRFQVHSHPLSCPLPATLPVK
jgi:hypothetical protein